MSNSNPTCIGVDFVLPLSQEEKEQEQSSQKNTPPTQLEVDSSAVQLLLFLLSPTVTQVPQIWGEKADFLVRYWSAVLPKRLRSDF